MSARVKPVEGTPDGLGVIPRTVPTSPQNALGRAAEHARRQLSAQTAQSARLVIDLHERAGALRELLDSETQALETVRALQPAADAYERSKVDPLQRQRDRYYGAQLRISDEELAGQLTMEAAD